VRILAADGCRRSSGRKRKGREKERKKERKGKERGTHHAPIIVVYELIHIATH
jgi:hypothetical protein